MKRLIFSVALILFLPFFNKYSIKAEPVTLTKATKVAYGKLIDLQQFSVFSIYNDYQIIKDEKQRTLFFIYQLVPQGYIVVTGDDDLPPIMAYSLTNDFLKEHKDNNSMLKFLQTDIELRISNLQNIPEYIKLKRKSEWNRLEQADPSKISEKIFQQWPPEGTTSTGGWLETNWTQTAPYNNFCPMDPVTNQRSVAGCPATAMAMILNYYKTLNNTVFSDNDDYHHNYAGRNYWIDDDHVAIDFPSFQVLNAYLDTINLSFEANASLKNNEKAALTFACGVAAHQVYTSQVSGTFGVNQALDAYLRFGFADALLLDNNDTSLYTLMAKNMMEARPVHLAVVDPGWTMGHNVVTDGYNTDNFFHLNFGWGGGYNGWYLLPDEIPYGLTVIEGAIVNIAYAPGITGNPEHSSGESALSFIVYPNPANHIININFKLNQPSQTKIVVYDIYGHQLELLVDGFLQNGNYSYDFNIRQNHLNLKSGIYLFILQVDEKMYLQKFIVR